MVTLADVRERIKSDMIISGSSWDAQIDDAIRSSLRQLRQSKYWFLEATLEITLEQGELATALPSDFSVADTFDLLSGTSRLTHLRGFDLMPYEDMKATYWTSHPVSTGTPVACAIFNKTLYFTHTADKEYKIRTAYFRQDATLPSANDTSVWFDDGYDVVRASAQYIFKRESQQFSATDEDGTLLQAYLANLGRQHEKYIAGA